MWEKVSTLRKGWHKGIWRPFGIFLPKLRLSFTCGAVPKPQSMCPWHNISWRWVALVKILMLAWFLVVGMGLMKTYWQRSTNFFHAVKFFSQCFLKKLTIGTCYSKRPAASHLHSTCKFSFQFFNQPDKHRAQPKTLLFSKQLHQYLFWKAFGKERSTQKLLANLMLSCRARLQTVQGYICQRNLIWFQSVTKKIVSRIHLVKMICLGEYPLLY